MTLQESDEVEARFISKTLCRLGGRKITETFTEAKALGVRVDMFANHTCRAIWTAAEELFGGKNYETVSISDIVIRAKQLVKSCKDKSLAEADPSYEFMEQANVSVRGDDAIDGYFVKLRDSYAERSLKEMFQKTIDAINAGDDTVASIAQLQSGCDALIRGAQIGGDGPSIEKIVDGVIKDFRDVFHHKQELGERDYVAGLPMAWPEMTKRLGGIGNVMTVVAARTGIGKTSFGVALMRFWLRSGRKVVFDSLDMESREMVIRQMSEGSLVASNILKNGDIPPERFESIISRYEEAGRELVEYERSGAYRLLEEHDVDILKSKVKILKDQGMIDVLVVDYIQLLNTKHGASEYDKITYVTKQLRLIANEIKVPVFALAQINRAPAKEGEEPELHDIKGSGEIEQDAANILILMPHKALKEKWETQPPLQYAKDPKYASSISSIMPMWVKIAKARDASPNFKFPFVVLQGRYSWYLGDLTADGDERFARVHLNKWKSDPIEASWKENGAVIDDEIASQIDYINQRQIARAQIGDGR